MKSQMQPVSVLRIHQIGLAMTLLLWMIVATSVPAQWVEQQKLLASSGVELDAFGQSVSIDGEYAIIGAPKNVETEDPASAYIFQKQDSDWVEICRLTASDGQAGDLFGNSVSISGDYAIVGAPFEDDNGSESGAAYIFERQGSNWQEMSKITAGDEFDEFGRSVSISGDYVTVGAPTAGENDRTGAAYVFQRQGSNWIEVSMLTAGNVTGSLFGNSVSISGEYTIVGAREDADNGTRSGAAYVFQKQVSDWIELSKITASDAATEDEFGRTVAISGNYAIVAAPNDDDKGSESGSAYIFERQNSDWIEVSKFTASDGAANDGFGWTAVAINGDQAIVGAFRNEDNGVASGSAYVFERQGSNWNEVSKLTASDGVAEDHFGLAVTISGDYAIIGANGDDDNGDFSGSAYVFQMSSFSHEVVSFTLIDSQNDQPVPGFDPIPDGAVLNIKQLPRFQNIRANTIGDVESVRFSFDGNSNFRTENIAPYALFGDSNGDYDDGRLSLGVHSLTATPYSLDGAQGDPGGAETISFTVVRENPGFMVTSFTLIDASTNMDLFSLNNDDVLDLSSLPAGLNVRADVLGQAQSVRFSLEPQGHLQTENVAPYALFGDLSGDYLSGSFNTGVQTLVATPFRQPNAMGAAGQPLSVNLTIVGTPPGETVSRRDRLTLQGAIPTAYTLDTAYPNPFNPATTIRFGLPERAQVRLIVYDMLGREVKTLADGHLEAGMHEVIFEAGALPSGTYLYRLETPAGSLVGKMSLLQ